MPRPRSRAAAAVAPAGGGAALAPAKASEGAPLPTTPPCPADAGALAALGWAACSEVTAYGHNARIFDVAPAPPSSTAFAGWVASAAEDDAVRVWRPPTETNGKEQPFTLAASFRGHTDPVLRVAWHPEPDATRALASASGDRTARVWRLEEREGGPAGRAAAVEVASLGGHAEEVYACEFLPSPSPTAFRLLTASGPGLETWEVRPDGSSTRLASGPPCAVGAVAEGEGGSVGPAPPTPARWAAAHIFGVALQPSSPARPLVATACSDGALRLWAVDASASASSCALSPACGVRAWARGVASSVAWSPDGAAVALTTTDGRAALFDVRRPGTAVWRGTLGEGGAAYGCAFVGGSGGEGGRPCLAVAAAGGVALFDVTAVGPSPAGWLRPGQSAHRRFLCVAAGAGGGVYAAGEAVEDGSGGGGGGEEARGVLWSTADTTAAVEPGGHGAKRSLWAPISVFSPTL